MQPFTSRNLPRSGPRPAVPRPIIPRSSTGPRPGLNPPRPGTNLPRPENSPRPGLNPPRPNPPHVSTRPIPQQPDLSAFLEDVRRDNQRITSDIRTITTSLVRMEGICQNLRDEYKELMESLFTIETSVYKDGLIKEAGCLFAKSMTRQPSYEDIGQAIIKVLGEDGRKHKYKFNKAKTFVLNRLTDIRSEERRRLFGNKPCESFPTFTTEKFVDKFYTIVKASASIKPTYIKHVALLRKFARESPNAQNDTYKVFRQWISEYYPAGITDEEWEQVTLEDTQYDYLSQSPGVGVSYEIGAGDGETTDDTVDQTFQ